MVGADEREGGERRILNFGHTVGHALEAETRYRHFLHGEAVGWGMIAAARIGEQIGITDSATAQRITDLVLSYGPLPKVKVAPEIDLPAPADRRESPWPVFRISFWPEPLGRSKSPNRIPKAVIKAVEHIKRLS